MSAYTRFAAIAASIRATLLAAPAMATIDENGNKVVPTMLDRDEDPAILAQSPAGLPAICVIPLGDKSADITYFMGGGTEVEHNFNVVIVGYYRATSNETRGEDIYDDIATLRQRGFSCADLFTGEGAYFNPGVVYHSRVELGYHETVDYVIYKFMVTLSVKTIACGSS
jgi:hypothetical protein